VSFGFGCFCFYLKEEATAALIHLLLGGLAADCFFGLG
jgi:hypothetical protein